MTGSVFSILFRVQIYFSTEYFFIFYTGIKCFHFIYNFYSLGHAKQTCTHHWTISEAHCSARFSLKKKKKKIIQRLERWLSCFSIRPEFKSLSPCGSSQPSVTLVPGDSMSSSGLYGHSIHKMHKHLWRQNAHTHVFFKIQRKKYYLALISYSE